MGPFEVICFPYTVYVAPTGTAFPTVDAAPSGSWTLLGTSGNKNYDDPGITVTHSQTNGTYSGAGSTTPRKAYRTAEGMTLGLSLVDLSPSQYALILDNLTVNITAQATGVAGEKHFEVRRGPLVHAYALLCRGISPVDETLTAQYEVAACYQNGNPAPQYQKGGPAMLALEFDVIEQTAGVFCTWRAQTTVVGP